MSIFTKIIDGEIPGVFVWRDPQCVAFLSIAPMKPGHTLVVPRREVDHWIDLDPVLVGVMMVGDKVPHAHIHVVPIDSAANLSFAHADHSPLVVNVEEAAEK